MTTIVQTDKHAVIRKALKDVFCGVVDKLIDNDFMGSGESLSISLNGLGVDVDYRGHRVLDKIIGDRHIVSMREITCGAVETPKLVEYVANGLCRRLRNAKDKLLNTPESQTLVDNRCLCFNECICGLRK